MEYFFTKKKLNIFVTGIGCCKQEIIATVGPIYDISRFGVNFVSLPEDADILVIQGFISSLGEKRLITIFNSLKTPKWIIAVGKCVVDSSLLNKNYKFTDKFKNILKIDYYLPGCPPRPEAFIFCLLKLQELI